MITSRPIGPMFCARTVVFDPWWTLLACAALILAAFAALILLAPPVPAVDYPQIQINSDTTTQLQNEQQICINPTDPENLVACWRDFRLGYRQVAIGYSLNGGQAWTDFLLGGPLPWDSDPVLIVDPDGTFYFAVLNYQSGGQSRLIVHRSATQGMTWEGPFTAVISQGSDFEDKEWIALDWTGGPRDGDLYLAWSRFNEVKIMCVSSADRGETWSAPVRVSDSGFECQWPVPVVLANGNLLVAWDVYDEYVIAYDISTNGGATWGTDRVLTYTTLGAGDMINGGITIFPYPCLVVDQSGGARHGWLYCMYADIPVGANGIDIWCLRSTDDGQTWSAPVRVNDDPPGRESDQFHPWLTCDEQGVLTAIWYDRRDDPANYLWHIYTSRSLDGGVTWEPSVRVTTAASSPADAMARAVAGDGSASGPQEQTGGGIVPLESTRAGLIGEYSGVAVRNGRIHPVWTDTRNGDQDTYTSYFHADSGVDDAVLPGGAFTLRVCPTPATGGGLLRLSLPDPGDGFGLATAPGACVEIADLTGRVVRRLPLGGTAAGGMRVDWDRRSDTGIEQSSGIYLARVRGVPGIQAPRSRIVLIR